MKLKLLFLLVIFSLLFSFSALSAEQDCLYYYFGEEVGCPDCQLTSDHLGQLVKKYPGLNLQQFNVYTNLEHFDRLQEYFTAYEVPEESRGIPAVFIGENYLVGRKGIEELLESIILSQASGQCPDLVNLGAVGIVGEKFPHNVIETLTLPRITATAFYDGFTLCALALMLVLLFLLVLADNQKKILKASLAFAAGVFLVYLLRGTGWIPFSPSSFLFYKIVGVLGMVLGLLLMVSFLKSHKSLLFASWQKVNKLLLHPVWIFLVGLAVSFFSLSCFDQKYALLSSLMAKPLTQNKALFLIVYYNLWVILPLLVLSWLVYWLFKHLETSVVKKSKYADKEELWKKHGLRVFRFVLGLAMLVLGILLVVL